MAAVALLVTDGVTLGGQDVTADGETFLTSTLDAEAAASPITVALNWASGAKEIFSWHCLKRRQLRASLATVSFDTRLRVYRRKTGS